MEILQLRYFYVVAKYESMSKAAHELNIVQPAVSQSIARLESELGVKLFDRKGRNIILNDAGKYLKKKVPSLLDNFDYIKEDISKFKNSQSTHITLIVLTGSAIIPKIISKFRKRYPDVQFTIIHSKTDEKYDICINSSYEFSKNKNRELLLEEEIVLVVPNNEHYKKIDEINLNEIKNKGFITLEKGKSFRKITDHYLSKINLTPTYTFESDSPSTVRRLIEEGFGIAFYPAKSWGRIPETSTKQLHITNFDFKRYIYIETCYDIINKKILNEFYNFTKEYIQNL